MASVLDHALRTTGLPSPAPNTTATLSASSRAANNLAAADPSSS